MRPSQAHFVTSCQQLLALGAVLAVLTPAASVISLDVVRQAPRPQPPGGHRRGQRPRRRADGVHPRGAPDVASCRRPRSTPRSPTTPSPPSPACAAGSALQARTVAGAEPGSTAVVSRPQAAEGYGGVGVTWDPSATATDDSLSFQVRTRTDGVLVRRGPDIAYDDDHGPDPDSPRGAATPGRAPTSLFVGRRRRRPGARRRRGLFPPAGMRMSVIAPGDAGRHRARGPGARHRRAAQRPDAAARSRHVGHRACSRRSRPSRRSTPASSGAPTSRCATRARCATSRCTPASSTTP